ncbi:MAG: prepilin-type N-terminal cleavage/methylation domain-containing protein [Victivallaceae bacterium]|nr:prepilin-type N-terminal cleavage/methylation domain-containing protein [Victivallaceae bacterium]
MKTTPGRRIGCFTLMELLVVITIISLLAALLGPGLIKARGFGAAVKCQANVRQLACANIMYASNWKNQFVPSCQGNNYWCGIAKGTWGSDISDEGGLAEYAGDKDVRDCPAADLQQEGGNNGCGSYGYSTAVGATEYMGTLAIPACTAQVTAPARTIMFSDNAGMSSGLYIQQSDLCPPLFIDAMGRDSGMGKAQPTMHFLHGDRASVSWADGHATSNGPITYTTSGWGSGEAEMLNAGLGWFGGEDEVKICKNLFRITR